MNLFSQLNEAPVRQKLDMIDAEVYFYRDFFTTEEADKYFNKLMENIEWQQDYIKFYGKEMPIPRLTAWYGESDKPYTYSGIPMKPHQWTKELYELKERIEVEANVAFTSVLLNLYRTGKDSVSWHSDDEKELGQNPIIGSISLGEERPFHFQHKKDKKIKEKILLTHGSFLLMAGETQHHWKHQIPKTSRDIQPRINLTFRVID